MTLVFVLLFGGSGGAVVNGVGVGIVGIGIFIVGVGVGVVVNVGGGGGGGVGVVGIGIFIVGVGVGGGLVVVGLVVIAFLLSSSLVVCVAPPNVLLAPPLALETSDTPYSLPLHCPRPSGCFRPFNLTPNFASV